ncbi:NADH:flavin oxidoreductase [Emticicia sp. CRIBPO]|uniref:oxidoreductase n=1 Tax=Emticicia sp. CRIBPO TaxID=2683258 RepID=UPI0014127C54|nr:NADH:flavin oxidoreductase [Emticicia sp. CRIBPO]NBA84862.1 NADH:flavin oxidoreductase [Emticicia sp. CRIBPO]
MKTFFDKTKLKSKTAANRFMVAPMTRVSADQEGIPSQEMEDYYVAFAAGGFGTIITEGIYTDDAFSKSYPNQPGLVNAEQVSGWKSITEKVTGYGTLMIAQLMHAGSISQALAQTKAPSVINPLGQKLPHYGGGSGPFPIPEAMNKKDIETVIGGFVNAALNAEKAGFDGVELHAANGYLLDQFITPYLNLRADEYGGSVPNRLRIITEITERLREQVSENFIVGLRISEGKVNHLKYRWEGGSETARAILVEISKMPINYLHVAAEHQGWREETRYPDGSSLSGIAKELLKVPVVANGKLDELTLAQHLLDTCQADFLAIGKAALANPDFVKKVMNHEELMPFDPTTLFPNPSLFSYEKHKKYLEKDVKMRLA